jgi:hypothetical protein
MQLTYEIIPVKGKVARIIVPYSVPEHKLHFKVVIDVTGRFLRFWVLILPHKKVRSKKKRVLLYHELLKANYALAEIKYFINEHGDVGVVGHEGVEVVTYEGFRDEFRAIPQGIIHFLTVIAKKLNLSITLPISDDPSFYL